MHGIWFAWSSEPAGELRHRIKSFGHLRSAWSIAVCCSKMGVMTRTLCMMGVWMREWVEHRERIPLNRVC